MNNASFGWQFSIVSVWYLRLRGWCALQHRFFPRAYFCVSSSGLAGSGPGLIGRTTTSHGLVERPPRAGVGRPLVYNIVSFSSQDRMMREKKKKKKAEFMEMLNVPQRPDSWRQCALSS